MAGNNHRLACWEDDMRRPRVLLAVEHRLVREAFANLLEPFCEVVGSVGDGRSLFDDVNEARPDLVLLEVELPLLSGIEAARQLQRRHPEMKLIYLTSAQNQGNGVGSIQVAASSSLSKDCTAHELLTLVQSASEEDPSSKGTGTNLLESSVPQES